MTGQRGEGTELRCPVSHCHPGMFFRGWMRQVYDFFIFVAYLFHLTPTFTLYDRRFSHCASGRSAFLIAGRLENGIFAKLLFDSQHRLLPAALPFQFRLLLFPPCF